ncbi:MAG: hypothetical protein ABH821_03610 [archaeon]
MEELLNKKLIVLSLLVIFLAQLSFAEITVERTINDTVLAGEDIEITLNVTITDEELSSIIVTEDLPNGWVLVDSSPTASPFEEKNKWLLYGSTIADGSVEITYSLTAPENFTDSQIVTGTWITIKEAGLIEGDGLIVAAEPEEPVVTPPQTNMPDDSKDTTDYTMYGIIAVIIIVIIAVVGFMLKKKKK